MGKQKSSMGSSRSASKSLGLWEKLSMTFSRPTQLFNSVSNQKDYWGLFKYYGVFVGIFFLIYWVYFNLSPQIQATYGLFVSPGLLWVLTFIGFVFYALFTIFAGPFISTAFSHLGVMWLGGKQGFYNTFKPLIYGGSLSLSYFIPTFLLLILGIFTGFIGGIIFSFIGGIVALVGMVHSLYVQSTGVAMYHKMSKWRAFFGIILVPLILAIIMVVIMVVFALLLVSTGGLNY